MPIERFFDDKLNLHDKEGQLEGDQMHHALKVFRLALGDRLEIINGHGLLAQASIIAITKKTLTYQVEQIEQIPAKLPSTVLILGMPKFNRLEFIVEKVCELGCGKIVLFNADRSEKTDLSKNQEERLNLLLQAALKQCGRLFLPSIEFRPHLEACLESNYTYYYGHIDTKAKIPEHIPLLAGIVIGPESGFSDKEKALLSQKACPISLSDAILRVDTASIVAGSLLQQRH
jgi:16S rRNA (uracil1498-N3)-methyltransferase